MEQPVNLLLVDDHPENLIALEAILSEPGHNLVTARSGAEALKKILESDFAVLLLDVMMPEMDGFELASLIKRREQSRGIPIIFLTAIAKDVEYIYKGYSVGAVDYLPKPLDARVVRSKVAVFVDLYRKNQLIKTQAARLLEGERREQQFKLAELKAESEKRYRNLAESLPQIVWTADAQGRLTYLNQRWTEYTGLPAQTGTDWVVLKTVTHPDDLKDLTEHFAAALKSSKPLEVESRLRAADQSYRWHLCRAVPAFDERKNLIGWVGTHTDIEDQKRMMEAANLLAKTSQFLASPLDRSSALEQVAIEVVRFFADLCVITLFAADQKSYSEKPIVAAHCQKMRERVDVSLLPQQALAFRKEIAVWNLQEQVEIKPDDHSLQLLSQLGIRSLISAPILASDETFGLIHFMLDQEARNFDEKDLHLAVDLAGRIGLTLQNRILFGKAQDASRAKSEFLANMSHELRTPLNAIMGFAELLSGSPLSDEDRVLFTSTIVRNGKQLVSLVDDILDLSKVEAGKMELMLAEVDLGLLIQEILDLFQPQARTKNLKLQAQAEGRVPRWIRTDPLRLRQVLMNIIGNAIKFTDRGEVNVTLRSSKHGSINISVQDTGCGIAAEQVPLLFQRFSQVDASATRKFGGTGLGLMLSKLLAQNLGGDVVLKASQPGRGCEFEVSVQAESLENTEFIDQLSSTPAGGIERRSDLSLRLDGKKILLADDSTDNRNLVARFFQPTGASVDCAVNGLEVLEMIECNQYDLILMDIQMPVLDGIQATQRLRERGYQQPVLALTAHAMPDEYARSLAAGCDDHLSKPIEADRLIQKVHEFIFAQDKPAPRSATSVEL